MVVRTPVVEPAVPELGAHQRPGRLVAAEHRQPLGGAGAERAGLVQLGQAAVVEHLVGGLVDGGQRHRDAAGPVELYEPRGSRVVAVGTVLVLDLHEDDRAAAVDLPGCHDGTAASSKCSATAAMYSGSLRRTPTAGSVNSQPGSPPLSHSAQMNGPGRTMAYMPSAAIRSRNRARSSCPVVSNAPGGVSARSRPRRFRWCSGPSGGPCGCGRPGGGAL